MHGTQLLTGNIVQKTRWQDSDGTEYSFADIGELAAFVGYEIRASKLKYMRIAELANVCPQTVSKLAYGTTVYPRANTVLQILSVLGFDIVARRR